MEEKTTLSEIEDQTHVLCTKVSSEEAEVLRKRIDILKNDYSAVKDTIDARKNLLTQWHEWSNAHKEIQTQIDSIIKKLETDNVNQIQLDRAASNLDTVREELKRWEALRPNIEELENIAGVSVRDTSSLRALSMPIMLDEARVNAIRASKMLDDKQKRMNEIATLWQEFDCLRKTLLGVSEKVENESNSIHIKKSDQDGVRQMQFELKSLNDMLHNHDQDYQDLKSMVRRITREDLEHAARANESLENVQMSWDTACKVIVQKGFEIDNVLKHWRQYNEAKNALSKTLLDVEPFIQEPIRCLSVEDVKNKLERLQMSERDLRTANAQLDNVVSRGNIVIDAVSVLPLFDCMSLRDEVNGASETVGYLGKGITNKKQLLEKQLSLWNNISAESDEVKLWLNSMTEKFHTLQGRLPEPSLANASLAKFEHEKENYEHHLDDLSHKLTTLHQLNENVCIPSMQSSIQNLEGQFVELVQIHENLKATVENLTRETSALDDEVDSYSNWVEEVREKISNLDDIQEDGDQLVDKVREAKSLQIELTARETKLGELYSKQTDLAKRFETTSPITVASGDVSVVKKKHSAALARASVLEKNLKRVLEERAIEAKRDQQVWMSNASDKVNWCLDKSGDRFSVEAKITTINELFKTLPDGKEKTNTALKRLHNLEAIHDRPQDVLNEATKINDEWQKYVNNVEKAKLDLESLLDKWKEYEELHDNLNNWLKKIDSSVRKETAVSLPSLTTKQDHVETLQDIEQEIMNRKSTVEQLKSLAGELSDKGGDDVRVMTYANQLTTKYESLSQCITSSLNKSIKNQKDHENYAENMQDAKDWLESTKDKLNRISNRPSADQNAAEIEQDTLKKLVLTMEQGEMKMKDVINIGENVLPNTAANGRDSIRRELRELKDDWNRLKEDMSINDKKIGDIVECWKVFEADHNQIIAWLSEVEQDVYQRAPIEYCSSLSEKRGFYERLNHISDDIESHSRLIDSLEEKRVLLSSYNANSKAGSAKQRYERLVGSVSDKKQEIEKCVKENEHFVENTKKLKEWISCLSEKASLCLKTCSDKFAVKSNLDKLLTVESEKADGEIRLRELSKACENVVSHTAIAGHQQLRNELSAVHFEWDKLNQKIHEIKSTLNISLKAWTDFDSEHDSLLRWIKITETEIRGMTLGSTLADKKERVAELKVCFVFFNLFSRVQSLSRPSMVVK